MVVRSVEDTWNPVRNAHRTDRYIGLTIPNRPIPLDPWVWCKFIREVCMMASSNLIFSSSSFRGSDDDLRSRFEEYICSVLATLKYSDYVRNGQNTVMPGGGEALQRTPINGREVDITMLSEVAPNFAQPYSEKWLDAFRQTSAYDTWNKCTDDLLFDICEPR
jgi:hypothetical protein